MADDDSLAIAEMVAEEALAAYRAMRRKYRVALVLSLIANVLLVAAILWRWAA